MSNNRHLILACVIISIIIASITTDSRYTLLFIEPLVFGAGIALCKPLKIHKFEYLALGILFLVALVRYVLIPLLMAISNYPAITVSVSDELFKKAIIYQIYEEVCFFITVSIFAPRIYIQSESSSGKIEFNNHNLFLNLVVIIGFILIVTSPSLLQRINFLPLMTNDSIGVDVDISDDSGWLLLFGYARYYLVAQIIVLLHKRYLRNNNIRYVFLSLIVIVINCLFVYDLSRFPVLQTAAVYIYLVYLLYPNHRRGIITFSILAISVSLIYLSYLKMFSEVRGGDEQIGSIESWALTLQMYFQGVSEVAIGLLSSESMPFPRYITFLNDAFANTAFISHFTVNKYNSLALYNYVYSGGLAFDKILPNVCAGNNYLGFLGAPIITVIISCLAMKFDSLCRTANDIYFKFVYAYACVSCSFPMMIYYAMTISALINSFLVMWLILIINRKVNVGI